MAVDRCVIPAAVFAALVALCAASRPGTAAAADVPPEFASRAEEERYQRLLSELRCLVCQNQSLADSSADLAQDLRDEVLKRVRAGQDDEAIVGFLVQRYGDFVLYRPPLKITTWLLWAGPFVLLVLAVAVILRRARAGAAERSAPLDEQEQRRVRELLGGPPSGDRS
jgi:cytochrome c-type biogenesis protein CcmH